jgi:hypothetical protein
MRHGIEHNYGQERIAPIVDVLASPPAMSLYKPWDVTQFEVSKYKLLVTEDNKNRKGAEYKLH